ncbi:MAG: hypothetical protein WCK85_09950 [Chlorobium sp.]
MTIVLLIVIVLLLLAILALLLTGWPGREQKELEAIGKELFRELAQQRADSVQLLHAMRSELEDSLTDTLEQKLDAIAALGSRSNNRRKKPVENPLQPEGQGAETDEENGQFGSSNAQARAVGDERQLGLFTGVPDPQKPKDKAPAELGVRFICAIDDIPDVNDLADFEDL